jgi:hypothetical protein
VQGVMNFQIWITKYGIRYVADVGSNLLAFGISFDLSCCTLCNLYIF